MIIIANNIASPSHGWMRSSVNNLKPIITKVVTDQASAVELSKHRTGIEFHRAWQTPPPAYRRIIGRLTGSSKKIWESEPSRRVSSILKHLQNEPLLIHYLDVAVDMQDVISDWSQPVLVHCHGADFDWDLRDHNGISNRNGEAYRERALALRQKIHIIANSTWTKSKLIDAGFEADRVHINYFGLETTEQTPQEKFAEDPINILFLGRLIDFKGPSELIRAFALARINGLNGTLTIAGDGPLRGKIEKLILELSLESHVKILGSVTSEQGSQLRAKADIFSAHNCTGNRSKRVETFGVSILEAMACGLPVVTGASGGIPDMITDGINGILFEPGNIEQHAKALLDLAGNPSKRRRLGEAAQQTVNKKFSAEAELNGIQRILKIAGSTNVQ